MIKPEEAGNTFEAMLIKAGFDVNKPNLMIAWNVFKEFIKLKVDCFDEICYFQCGINDFEDHHSFYWDLVRQFEIEEAEDEHAEQLHFEVLFKPDHELEKMEASIWSSDYDSLAEFIQEVEGLNEFKVPMEKYVPFQVEIYQEEM